MVPMEYYDNRQFTNVWANKKEFCAVSKIKYLTQTLIRHLLQCTLIFTRQQTVRTVH